jgi:hypothetical protein
MKHRFHFEIWETGKSKMGQWPLPNFSLGFRQRGLPRFCFLISAFELRIFYLFSVTPKIVFRQNVLSHCFFELYIYLRKKGK